MRSPPSLPSPKMKRGSAYLSPSPQLDGYSDTSPLPQRLSASMSPLSVRRRSSSSATTTPASLKRNRVRSGRIQKSSPTDRRYGSPSDLLEAEEIDEEQAYIDGMDKEKELFPGSKDWAEDELRLFEILYMRQYSPLLPRTWDMDFRGISVPSILFATSDAQPPVIFSRSGAEFKATKALLRLVDLTASVRSLLQAGQSEKVSPLICRELEEYAKWAAQDGGYDNLDIIPNVIIDMVDTTAGSTKIEEYMRDRLQALAERHRQYWLIDSKVDDSPLNKRRRVRSQLGGSLTKGRAARESPNSASSSTDRQLEEECGSVLIKEEEEYNMPTLEFRYTQKPPVLYGIFVVHSTVLVLSMDSSKEGAEAFVSYQVEIGFNVKDQGVWNAITVAIIICLARDHMVTLANDFVQLVVGPESDIDA